MLESKFMFAHLGKNGAYVEMYVTRIADLEAVLNSLLAEVQIIILDFECFLEIR